MAAKLNFSAQLHRNLAIPLDTTTVFTELSELNSYVEQTDNSNTNLGGGNYGTDYSAGSSVYNGQIITFIDSSGSTTISTIYLVKEDPNTSTNSSLIAEELVINGSSAGGSSFTSVANQATFESTHESYSVGEFVYCNDTNKTFLKIVTDSTFTTAWLELLHVDSVIDESNIAAGAVTTSKIATDAITTTKIVDDAVTDAKITALSSSKLTGDIPTNLLPNWTITTVTVVADDEELYSAATSNATSVGDVVIVLNSADATVSNTKATYIKSIATVVDDVSDDSYWIELTMTNDGGFINAVTSTTTAGASINNTTGTLDLDLSLLDITIADSMSSGTGTDPDDFDNTKVKAWSGAYYNDDGSGARFQIKLGENEKLGGFSDGDFIDNNTSLGEILTKLLQKEIIPTYSNPTFTFTVKNATTTIPSIVEIGTTIPINDLRYNLTYDTNVVTENGSGGGGGPIAAAKIYETSNWSGSFITVDPFNTSTVVDGNDSYNFIFNTNKGFSANWSASIGPVVLNTYGDVYSQAQIAPHTDSRRQNIDTGTWLTRTISAKRRIFIYHGTDCDYSSSTAIRAGDTSLTNLPSDIWSGTGIYSAIAGNSNPSSTYNTIVVAIPTSNSVHITTTMDGSAWSVDDGFIPKDEIAVHGADGFTTTQYKVYVKTLDTPADGENQYKFEIS